MKTRIPLPEAEYIKSLGQVAYAVSYLEWAVIGYLARVKSLPPSLDISVLAGYSTGEIGRALCSERSLSEITDKDTRNWLKLAGSYLIKISKKRNAIFHARPATTEDKKQRLYRWRHGEGQQFMIEQEYISALLAEIEAALSKIDSARPRNL